MAMKQQQRRGWYPVPKGNMDHLRAACEPKRRLAATALYHRLLELANDHRSASLDEPLKDVTESIGVKDDTARAAARELARIGLIKLAGDGRNNTTHWSLLEADEIGVGNPTTSATHADEIGVATRRDRRPARTRSLAEEEEKKEKKAAGATITSSPTTGSGEAQARTHMATHFGLIATHRGKRPKEPSPADWEAARRFADEYDDDPQGRLETALAFALKDRIYAPRVVTFAKFFRVLDELLAGAFAEIDGNRRRKTCAGCREPIESVGELDDGGRCWTCVGLQEAAIVVEGAALKPVDELDGDAETPAADVQLGMDAADVAAGAAANGEADGPGRLSHAAGDRPTTGDLPPVMIGPDGGSYFDTGDIEF